MRKKYGYCDHCGHTPCKRTESLDVSKFEKLVREKEETEMMADFVHHNLDALTPAEIAQAIREGVTTLKTIDSIIHKL